MCVCVYVYLNRGLHEVKPEKGQRTWKTRCKRFVKKENVYEQHKGKREESSGVEEERRVGMRS